MRGHAHARSWHLIVALGGGLLLTGLPATGLAQAESGGSLPLCDGDGNEGDGVISAPWRAELDEDGVVTGFRLALRVQDAERVIQTGPRGFVVRVGGRRLLVGERGDEGTQLDMLDVRRGCRLWSRHVDQLLYPQRARAAGPVRLTMLDPSTRQYGGTGLLDPQTGSTAALPDVACLEYCLPTDGALTAAALEPAGAPRPTPDFPGGGWPAGRTLGFRWQPGAVPPAWARTPLLRGAADASSTSAARSPRFEYRSGAVNAVAYSGRLAPFCGSAAIACAGRDIPSSSWGVWIRPYGWDFSWGRLRWCQKTSSSSGCFDIRRVMLHELGHVTGLDHPSSHGFTLSASHSVMQGITPARPQAGASRHAFGDCDVATLQELYDTPDNKTHISPCNDVATNVTLSTSRSTVRAGAPVKLTATLTVDSQNAYRKLSGNVLNGRSLKLKYRRAGSSDGWTTLWMRSLYWQGRYELTITPTATWEFKAVFPNPPEEGLRYSRSGIKKVRLER